MATNKIQTGLRLNEDIYQKVKIISAKECRSFNNLIEYIVQSYVEDYEERYGPIQIPEDL